MERAIKDLCQLADAKLFEEVSTGIGHVLELVDKLDAAVRELSRAGHHHAARILRNQAEEEAAKVLILVDAVRCPPKREEDRYRTLGYFYQHVAKGIYVEVCKWRPLDFKEVIRGVEDERVEYYLDGPNDVDWIFSNRIKRRREDDLYVGYVRDDSEENGEGEHHYWVFPVTDELDALFRNQPPPVIRTARALHRVGATTPAGLAVVAEVWRPVDVWPEMRIGELQGLNRRTLEILTERDLLPASAGEVGAVIWHDWPFPLWPRDLRMREVKREKLRQVQRAWSPENW